MLIKNFQQISKSDTQIAGGKGASLGEMTSAGIPVPPGFVVLSEAFEQFLTETDLNIEIEAILKMVDNKKIHTVENASEKIQLLILEAKMPEDIKKEIQKNFKKLDAKWVAVRSSATAEDGAEAAWAGQLESYLNTTEKTLLENVQKCWASLFTPRAIFYRFEKKLHKQKISVAVVVQKMIQSEISGIAFSVHPVTEDYNQLIIEAGYGLGEAIVSGSITPDSYVIDKTRISEQKSLSTGRQAVTSKAIIDININTQSKGLYIREKGGNEWRNITEPKASSQVLSKKEIVELSELIIKIEKHYGFPVDIEWAHENKQFYIVQSRPITTLQKKKKKISGESFVIEEKEYEKHQRDYSLLIGVVGCSALFSSDWKEYLPNFEFNPIYIIIDDGILYHAVARNDYQNMAAQWMEVFGTKKALLLQDERHQEVLNEFDDFIGGGYGKYEAEKSLEMAHGYFFRMFPFILITLEIAEHISENKKVQELAFAIRKKNEHVVRSIMDLQSKMLALIEKKNKLASSVLGYLLPEELVLFYDNKRLPLDIKKRKEFVIVEVTPVGKKMYFGRKNKKSFPFLFPNNDLKLKTSEIEGVIAQKGKSSGLVKVVLKVEDAKKVLRGDVLVASMTDPRYLSAIKKSCAIVTDEGGITCHAAIVARELNKPCIIGTKIATQVLKDGDLVEVDANEGIVRILKKAKKNLAKS
jgi:phosphoenolpyruvate synthase/pyruvate phosphate dikinase